MPITRSSQNSSSEDETTTLQTQEQNRNTHKKLTRENKKLKDESNVLQSSIERLTASNLDLLKELEEERKKQPKSTKQAVTKAERLLKKQHKDELKKLEEKHKSKIKNLHDEYKSQEEKLVTRHNSNVVKLLLKAPLVMGNNTKANKKELDGLNKDGAFTNLIGICNAVTALRNSMTQIFNEANALMKKSQKDYEYFKKDMTKRKEESEKNEKKLKSTITTLEKKVSSLTTANAKFNEVRINAQTTNKKTELIKEVMKLKRVQLEQTQKAKQLEDAHQFKCEQKRLQQALTRKTKNEDMLRNEAKQCNKTIRARQRVAIAATHHNKKLSKPHHEFSLSHSGVTDLSEVSFCLFYFSILFY